MGSYIPKFPGGTVRAVDILIDHITTQTVLKITVLFITLVPPPPQLTTVDTVSKVVTFCLVYSTVTAAALCTAWAILSRSAHGAGFTVTIPSTFNAPVTS